MYGEAICLLGSLLEGAQRFLGLEVLGPLHGGSLMSQRTSMLGKAEVNSPKLKA